MKKFFKEFKEFVSRGNIMDMAVGVIIGGAFGKIVTSLVNDILMPLITLAMGGSSLADLSVVLNGKEKYLESGAINPDALLWHYGNFIQTIIDFLIIALSIFLIIKLMMKIKSAAVSVKDGLLKHDAAENEAVAAAEIPTETQPQPAQPQAAVQSQTAVAETAGENQKIIELLTQIKESLDKR